MQAWILPLDRIVAIEWSGVEDMNVTQAVKHIRWPAGTQVILTVEREVNWQKELLDIAVTREKITIPSVKHEIYTTNNKKIWYINISMIWEETENLLKKSISELEKENIQGVIVDLRWNGGGFLPIAIEISSHFIPKDTLIATAKYKTYATEEY
jgi:carboxyl-terminal processing protease